MPTKELYDKYEGNQTKDKVVDSSVGGLFEGEHFDQNNPDMKLDFKDVLIRPKRSNLTSRSEVDVERDFTFKHSSYKWKGVPIMIANMDTTGTFEMAEAVSKHKIFTCIHKYYSLDDWIHFSNHHIQRY